MKELDGVIDALYLNDAHIQLAARYVTYLDYATAPSRLSPFQQEYADLYREKIGEYLTDPLFMKRLERRGVAEAFLSGLRQADYLLEQRRRTDAAETLVDLLKARLEQVRSAESVQY